LGGQHVEAAQWCQGRKTPGSHSICSDVEMAPGVDRKRSDNQRHCKCHHRYDAVVRVIERKL